MEFVPTKRNRKCKKKRHWRKRLRDQVRVGVEVEVRSSKRRKTMPGHVNTFGTRVTPATNAMQADAFWKNYVAAQDWQAKHNVTWWRSRCMALERENEILRNKIKSLMYPSVCPDTGKTKAKSYKEFMKKDQKEVDIEGMDEKEEVDQEDDDEADELEFTVSEEMLRFMEKSERHRRAMKQQQKTDDDSYEEESTEDNIIIGGAVSARIRKEEAIELYGDASSKILAMEAALQATMDNYKDKVKPKMWPNIPLKL